MAATTLTPSQKEAMAKRTRYGMNRAGRRPARQRHIRDLIQRARRRTRAALAARRRFRSTTKGIEALADWNVRDIARKRAIRAARRQIRRAA